MINDTYSSRRLLYSGRNTVGAQKSRHVTEWGFLVELFYGLKNLYFIFDG